MVKVEGRSANRIPLASASELGPYGARRTGEIRGPGPTWNLSYVFTYDIYTAR